jgi:3-mercaptopyruvate sulfurtransferase SseA
MVLCLTADAALVAHRRFRRAREGRAGELADPNSYEARFQLAQLYVHVGLLDEALAELDLATIGRDKVHERLHDDSISLVDACPSRSYAGTTANPNVPSDRQGHIPGVYNLPWQQLLRNFAEGDHRLKDAAALRSLLKGAGATPRAEVVTYCYSGMMSSLAYFAARYLGYSTKLYDGSYIEWSVNRELPVATCASPWCD